MKTAQEEAWRGEFGEEYSRRSPGDDQRNWEFLWKTVGRQFGYGSGSPRTIEPRRILELGAGTGSNLRALQRLYPHAKLEAVEINRFAASQIPTAVEVHVESLLDWQPPYTYDLVLVKGVLIHVNPDHLGMAYETIHRAMGRHLLIAEYFNPTPVAVTYRGYEGLLWKRDFAGELLDRYQDLRVLDYGFAWKRDTGQDDITWFLLEKTP